MLFLIGNQRKNLFWLLFFFVIQSIFEIFGISLIVPYISIIANPSLLDPKILKTVNVFFKIESLNYFILIIGFLLLLLFFIKSILSILINKKILFFIEKIQLDLRSKILTSYQSMDYDKYVYKNSSEIIQTIQTYISQFSNGVLLSFLRISSEFLIILFILILLAISSGMILIIFVLLFITFIVVYDFFFKGKLKMNSTEASISGKKMIEAIQESFEGFKEIRILGNQLFFHKKMVLNAQKLAQHGVSSQIIISSPRFMMEFLLVFVIVIIILFSLYFYDSLENVISILGLFGIASLRLLPSINQITNCISQIRFGKLATDKIFEELKMFNEISPTQINEKKVQFLKTATYKELLINDLWFKYSNEENFIFSGCSFFIKEGETVGVIGSSGSGKTTLIDLLLGLLKPVKGEILLNGENLFFDLENWHSQVAYLPQNVFLSNSTILENVALGQAINLIDKEKVLRCLKKAQLLDFVNKLSDGVFTSIGERGSRLSGGQKQRIALARAFYYDKEFLILDESTSSLDNNTETLIIDEIKKLKGKKTMIIIAHRLSTVQNCDRIYNISSIGKLEQVENLF